MLRVENFAFFCVFFFFGFFGKQNKLYVRGVTICCNEEKQEKNYENKKCDFLAQLSSVCTADCLQPFDFVIAIVVLVLVVVVVFG